MKYSITCSDILEFSLEEITEKYDGVFIPNEERVSVLRDSCYTISGLREEVGMTEFCVQFHPEDGGITLSLYLPGSILDDAGAFAKLIKLADTMQVEPNFESQSESQGNIILTLYFWKVFSSVS